MRRPHVYSYQGHRIVLESQSWVELQASSSSTAPPRPQVAEQLVKLNSAPLTAPVPALATEPRAPRWPTWAMLPSRAQLDEQLVATYPDALARAVAVAIVLADRDSWRAAAAKYFDQGLDESAAARQAVVELELDWRARHGYRRLGTSWGFRHGTELPGELGGEPA